MQPASSAGWEALGATSKPRPTLCQPRECRSHTSREAFLGLLPAALPPRPSVLLNPVWTSRTCPACSLRGKLHGDNLSFHPGVLPDQPDAAGKWDSHQERVVCGPSGMPGTRLHLDLQPQQTPLRSAQAVVKAIAAGLPNKVCWRDLGVTHPGEVSRDLGLDFQLCLAALASSRTSVFSSGK